MKIQALYKDIRNAAYECLKDAVQCDLPEVSIQKSVGKYEIVVTMTIDGNYVQIYDENEQKKLPNITERILNIVPSFDEVYRDCCQEEEAWREIEATNRCIAESYGWSY